jgi:hypothetical protein
MRRWFRAAPAGKRFLAFSNKLFGISAAGAFSVLAG